MIVRLVPHGDLLCLLLGQRFSVSTTVPGRCVYYVAVRLLFQSGQQAEDILGHVSSLQIRMLITTAAAAEFRMVISFIFSLQFLHQLHKLAHAHGAGQEFVSVPEHHIVAVLTPSGIFPGPS